MFPVGVLHQLFIGVSNDPSQVGGAFLDGNQAYQIEDIDGTIRLEFIE